jgi:hypothetical protein
MKLGSYISQSMTVRYSYTHSCQAINHFRKPWGRNILVRFWSKIHIWTIYRGSYALWCPALYKELIQSLFQRLQPQHASTRTITAHDLFRTKTRHSCRHTRCLLICLQEAVLPTYRTILVTSHVYCDWYGTLLIRKRSNSRMMNAVFWDVVPCGFCVNRRFGGSYSLHLQGRRVCERGTNMSK